MPYRVILILKPRATKPLERSARFVFEPKVGQFFHYCLDPNINNLNLVPTNSTPIAEEDLNHNRLFKITSLSHKEIEHEIISYATCDEEINYETAGK